MSRSVNKVTLVGNVGQDPEIKTTSNGVKLAKLSLATNRSYNNSNGEKIEKTEWHRLTFWSGIAGVVEKFVTKGDRLYIEGRIEYSQSTDDQGVTRYWTDIVVTEMVMLGRTHGNGGGGGEDYQQSRPRQSAPQQRQNDPLSGGSDPSNLFEPGDDLPF